MSDSSASLIGESILSHENLKLRRRIAELQAQLGEVRAALLAIREAVPWTDDAADRVQLIVSKALAGEEE